MPKIKLGHYQTALALDDRDPWAYFAQGNLLIRTRRPDDGIRAMRRALELNPNFALAHAYIAVGLTHRGRFDEAADKAHHALRLSPNDRNVAAYASMTLALISMMAGDYAAAADWSRNVTEKSPQWPAGHLQLTAALAFLGDAAGAAEARTALLRVRPDFSLSWMKQNLPLQGEMFVRISEGLRKAGIPEE